VRDDEAISAARDAVAIAMNQGAVAAEAVASLGSRFSVEARQTTVTKLERSIGKSLSLRVFVEGGRKAALSTADFSHDSLRDAIARAVAQAAVVGADPHAGLPDQTADGVPDLDLFDDTIAARDDAQGIDDVLEMERELRASDARIDNSSGSHYAGSVSTHALANSNGFAGVYSTTRASRSASPVASDGEHKRTAHYGTAARRLDALESNASVARMAARRTVEMFGAGKPATMRVPVVFERDVAAAVLSDIFSAVSAANVAVGNSWLSGRLGERIGSEAVTIVDDGRLAGRLGSSPFDSEGVATRRTVVVERGILRTFLYDTYYARRLGAATTANASGGGIGPNNFYLEPGSGSLDDLIASTGRGVLVLDTIGFASEHATGTFSRGARGFSIEGGELVGPIEEFTIAASLPDMLAGIDAAADDLHFDASIVAPSFRVAQMQVSGI
jgi:PmbA protein